MVFTAIWGFFLIFGGFFPKLLFFSPKLELRCLEGLRDPGGDPESVMVAPPPPRGDAPEFADPRLLPVSPGIPGIRPETAESA